jgi:hypothetical protein
MSRRLLPSADRRRVLVLAAAGIALPAIARPTAPPTSILYACQSGQETLDEGHGGGNPFASALIDCLSERQLTLRALPARMRSLTTEKSEEFQLVDAGSTLRPGGYRLAGPGHGGSRVALVMTVSKYSHAGVPVLAGAARDGARVQEALFRGGYDVTYAADLDRAAMISALEVFSKRTRSADAAVIYATGHGVESRGTVRMLAPDYRPGQGEDRLPDQSLAIPTLAAAAQASTVNLMFWAGCRSPFTY